MEDKEIAESLVNPWTSIDLYYKGFHIKKSFPQSLSRVDIIREITGFIEDGFEPSWNAETNAKQDPIMKVTQGMDKHTCPIHKTEMKQSQKGNWYHRSDDNTLFCLGKGWIESDK